jgi:RES domain-containing protein
MLIYRIASCQYINDLSGKGAALYGGRWNSKDIHMVYTAESAALALLETVVHIGKIPETGYCMITIQLPSDKIQKMNAEALPGDWHKNPPPDSLKTIGDEFINSGIYIALQVPSVIMPEGHNFLLNPAHTDFKKVKITAQRMLTIDERLLHARGIQ